MFKQVALKDLFDLKKQDVVSLVGAGGKTTLLEKLGQTYKKDARVLVTTSTKFRIDKDQVDYFYNDFEEFEKLEESELKSGLYAIVDGGKNKDRQLAIKEKELKTLVDIFDYSFIEADGCKRFPFKIWKDHEPVIYRSSNITIGTLPIKILGQKVGPDNTYNYEGFREKFTGDYITRDLIYELIIRPDSMFKDSHGRKIFYLNQVDTGDDLARAKDLIRYLADKTEDIDYRLGSLYEDKYFKYEKK